MRYLSLLFLGGLRLRLRAVTREVDGREERGVGGAVRVVTAKELVALRP